MFQPLEQEQQLDLLFAMPPENIFNSDSSALTFSNTFQTSSVHSVTGVDSPSLVNINIPKSESFFMDSMTGASFGQTFQDLFPAFPLLKLPTMVAPPTSLKMVMDRKRRQSQITQQNTTENLNSFHGMNMPVPAFLEYSAFPLVRGFCSGGKIKPPKNQLVPGTEYVNVCLELLNVNYEGICLPKWNEKELEESRRIVRVEKRRQYNKIEAAFSIVDSVQENPQTNIAVDPNVDVLEFSCLLCPIKEHNSEVAQTVPTSSSSEEHKYSELAGHDFEENLSCGSDKEIETSVRFEYYITSVEVIRIIEFLTENHLIQDIQAKRRERSCLRSNLVRFWSKDIVPSSTSTMSKGSKPSRENDCIEELAQRIRAYKVRKPLIVDKSLRILEWSKLGPALERALQSYYVALPLDKIKTKL
ncbi:Hypothetical protein PP7435_CHR1-1388 [Komagataella phaffii CBS 7435]|uniref:DUF7082 domain-containing protein n=2 Tax=Komagataella phaffii TaxID=460519 RepID=C4QYW5_KOMPG|nr:Hypothetical protein PAS_chr1-4_0582 [Komagataella phaffii GS115]AOA60441.1 GQ67_01559T0 [Komagataella phaffii]CAH2447266.1 Hypothetical protein BQ9382_C1-7270 [Komagataella phaffii CBS 7435]AOA66227.1 GQ68_01575T0 [Komagataella phaffii GS115]CAY68439.1 Hypothetical protein PAS_chr1-4_0582 [Komagataella phaffii GS115]CCA37504.1 Hypothetical protein PP7435_CHR1-1388 [Komagataella phaffii CBS 7435]